MKDTLALGEVRLDPATLVALSQNPKPAVKISPQALKRLHSFRQQVEASAAGEQRVYGVNTGFGYLADVKIPAHQLELLQLHLIRSHACGVGDDTPLEVVRGLLLLRAHSFLLGHSGVSQDCLDSLLGFLTHDILPRLPQQGSVGASGDLAPLAHLALGLIGEGEVYYKGRWWPAKQALEAAGLKPLRPGAKEGLALINGTHYMTAVGAFAVCEALVLAKSADIIAALSLDAVRGSRRPFDRRIHELRPHTGQLAVAANLSHLLGEGDEILASHKDCSKVQDPYSFRCIPQVHGASRDAIDYALSKLTIELNSVTDNPLVFDGELISGGNFHGQPMALCLDFLGIAVAELGSIAERRIEKMTNPHLSGLPAFVMSDSGLNSGYMIPHVVAAALVSENKVMAHPASVDSIPTSADKEDHVSMGPIAARKARSIIQNVNHILAIELLAACQALDLLRPLKPAPLLERVYQLVRQRSPYMPCDRSLHEDIKWVAALIKEGKILECVAEGGFDLH